MTPPANFVSIETCLDCARKHLSAALVGLFEAQTGYPLHRWLVVGELEHAAQETLNQYPELSHAILAVRRAIISNPHTECGREDIMYLIGWATMLAGEMDTLIPAENANKRLGVLRKLAVQFRCPELWPWENLEGEYV